MKKYKSVYLDNASNTPLDKRVLSVMKPYLQESFVGNSHSTHEFGIKAMLAIEDARQKIAKASGMKTEEIFFTSGATESNNWVLKSLAFHEIFEEKTPKLHAVVSAVEHASILNTCKQLEKMGFSITYVQPDWRGIINTREVRKALRFNTLFVCVMAVNNETGAQNPIDVIGELAHKNKSYMISDCTQLLTYGGSCCNLKKKFPNVDYFTFSGHKIYGPTGVGCLIARTRVPLYSFITGGGQESGKRGGTSNTAGIVGLGEAYKLISENDYKDFFEQTFNYLKIQLLNNKIPYRVNGFSSHQNIISLNLSDFMDDSDLASLFSNYGIACSAGSACEAKDVGISETIPSHVLSAMGVPVREINNSIRISFSKYTTRKDIDALINIIKKLYLNFRREKNENQIN